MKTVSSEEFASVLTNQISSIAADSWLTVLKNLKEIFGPDFRIVDERYAILDLKLFLLSWELLYIRRNQSEENYKHIEKAVCEIIGMQDFAAYSLAEISDYINLYNKDNSTNKFRLDSFIYKLLSRLIRDEEKFTRYNFDTSDVKKTWTIFNSLLGVAKSIDENYKIKNKSQLIHSLGADMKKDRVENKSKKKKTLKNWKIAGVILTLLILAMFFRWETVSSKTEDTRVIKFRQDNWNGAIYQETYYTNGRYDQKLSKRPYLEVTSSQLTWCWRGLTGISAIWLIFSLSNRRDVEN